MEPRWFNTQHTGRECKRCGFDFNSRCNIFHFHHPVTLLYQQCCECGENGKYCATSLAFRASGLPLHPDVTTIPTPQRSVKTTTELIKPIQKLYLTYSPASHKAFSQFNHGNRHITSEHSHNCSIHVLPIIQLHEKKHFLFQTQCLLPENKNLEHSKHQLLYQHLLHDNTSPLFRNKDLGRQRARGCYIISYSSTCGGEQKIWFVV